MVFLQGIEVRSVSLFVKQTINLRCVFDFKLHKPSVFFGSNRNVLRLILELFVDAGNFAIAGHVHIGSCLYTLDSALQSNALVRRVTTNLNLLTIDSPLLNESPYSGRSTWTMSPRALAANLVMPSLPFLVSESTSIHSCVFENHLHKNTHSSVSQSFQST